LNQKRLTRVCVILMLICLVGITVGVDLLLKNEKQAEKVEQINPPKEELTEVIWNYPKKIELGQNMEDLVFENADEQAVSLKELSGKYTMVTYWASWCHYCKEQMKVLMEQKTLLEQENVKCILIDKLDGKKETKSKAQDYLRVNKIMFPVVYDKGVKVYEKLGVCIVPTTFFLNENGELIYCYAGVIETKEQLSSIISYVKKGLEADVERFVTESMMGSDGGIHTNLVERDGKVPCGYDVLSESQGLMMQYAAGRRDAALFERAFFYVKTHLYRDQLAVWVYSKDKQGNANALIDDLRMLKAVDSMSRVEPKYEEETKLLADAIVKLNVRNNQQVVDFYDFSSKAMANRLTLCYADFKALGLIKKQHPEIREAYDETLRIVENGYISDRFPFYYNYYDYEKKEYNKASLNMAEGLYTLFHLAEIGELKDTSIAWLKNKLSGNGIWARYDMNGEVVEGYEYQSTAIYALTGLIALEIQDQELLTMAVSRMEEFRCFDDSSSINGAFGENENQIMSYDQCMALLLYGRMKSEMDIR